MRLSEIFESDVKRDIPPVVYFHEKSAERLHDEVREYIITGGYARDDPRHHRVPDGIHEQMKHLLRANREDIGRLINPSDLAVVAFDFQYLSRAEDRRQDAWVKESSSEQRRHRLVWVGGTPSGMDQRLKELVRNWCVLARW